MPNYLHMQIAKYVKLAFACPWLPSSGLYSPDPRACRLFGGICTRYPGEANPLPGSQGHYPSPHPYRLPPTPFSVPAMGVQREAGNCPAPAVSPPKKGSGWAGCCQQRSPGHQEQPEDRWNPPEDPERHTHRTWNHHYSGHSSDRGQKITNKGSMKD